MKQKLLDSDDMASEKDWRRALRSPTGYRVINKTLKGQSYFILIVVLGLALLIAFYYLIPKHNSYVVLRNKYYNNTYPLSAPIKTNFMHTFRIGIVTDLDTQSKSIKEPNIWFSYFKKGYLSYSPKQNTVVVTWDNKEPVRLTSSYALKDRGMELSELVVFNGRLLSFDDRTGIIYEILNDRAIPWVLLTDGDGRTNKGFKSEWATVRDQVLYVGSMGKEWTTADGLFQNNNPMYLKAVTTKGEVTHLNWAEQYKRIRGILDIRWPGYMIHESGIWSDVHQRWFFLPRRCSHEVYNEVLDEKMGCSVLISADPEVYDVKIVQIANSAATRGFSSFKFIPTSNDEVIVALRTEELDGKTATYITAFTIQGVILLDDSHISDQKYEGLEFI